MITIHPVHHLNRAISYGESCFETIASINGTIFDWDRHLKRLATGCAELGMVLHDDDLTQLTAAVHHGTSNESDIIRLTATSGDAKWGIITPSTTPQFFIQRQPRKSPSPAHLVSMNHPYGARTVSAKFSSDYGTMLRLGGRDIFQQGAMPLLWHHDRLCCAATANVALHLEGQWFTPPLEQGGVLAGIIRHHLMAAGLIDSRLCDRSMVSRCSAIALLNSGNIVQAAASIDGTPLINRNAANELHQAIHAIITNPS